jgi:hypothetical protein
MPEHNIAEARFREWAIAAAIEQRRIPARDRDTYRARWDGNPTAYYRLLCARVEDGGLAANIVPAEASAASGPDDYDASWLSPSERAAVEAQRQSEPAPIPTAPRVPPPPPPAPAPPRARRPAAPQSAAAAPSGPVDSPSTPAPTGSSTYPLGMLSPAERRAIESRERGESPPPIAGDGEGGVPPGSRAA